MNEAIEVKNDMVIYFKNGQAIEVTPKIAEKIYVNFDEVILITFKGGEKDE